VNWGDFGKNGTVDWKVVFDAAPEFAAMRECFQDPVFHQEGEVWTHTVDVVSCLHANPAFADLPEDRRIALSLAALLHDVAKPQTRDVEMVDGRLRVTHNGHSRYGAIKSWEILWRQGVPREIRDQVFSLIMWHQRVFHVFSKEDLRAELARFSIVGNWSDLVMLAKADNRGRIAPNQDEVEERLELVAMAAEEESVLSQSWPFPSEQARMRFAKGAEDSLFYHPMDPAGSSVVVLTGFPGVGKDTYAEANFSDRPHVSLDGIRIEMGVSMDDDQGSVLQESLERIRTHLRGKEPFLINATNLTRDRRGKLIDLCLAYDARVDIHSLELPEKVLRQRNRDRTACVPNDVLDRMIQRFEPPSLMEAHAVTWIHPSPSARPSFIGRGR
jgi:predicted kinase